MIHRQWAWQNRFLQVLIPVVSATVFVAFVLDPAVDPWDALTPLLLLLSVLLVHATTRIEANEIVVAVMPFWRRRIQAGAILSTQIVSWRPIRDFGGWGIRIGQDATLYNMHGKRGVQLELAGRDLIIGSSDPEALLRAIDEARGVLRP